MNVLLINPPIRETFPPYYHPVGLATIAAVLREAGHDVEIYDINALRLDKLEAVRQAPHNKYDWIGISGLITTYNYLCFLVPVLRRIYPDVPLVIGGGGISSAPEVYMNNLKPDYGVIGEGEYTALELSNGKDPQDILGLAYWDDGLVINPPRPPDEDVNRISRQAFDLMDMDVYAETLRHNRHATKELAVFATRGCPFTCGFCYHVFGRRFRYRDVDSVLDEMEYLVQEYGVDSFMFGDECFTVNKKYVREFCEKKIARDFVVPWTCFSRVDTLDEKTAWIMKEAGCIQVGFGIESGSQKMLDAMGKGVTVEQMRDALELARVYFPRVTATFIFGYPGETPETICETTHFMEDFDTKGAPFHLQPYPGTKVYEENRGRIIAAYGSEHDYFRTLGDARSFVINLTDMPDSEYFERFANITRGICCS